MHTGESHNVNGTTADLRSKILDAARYLMVTYGYEHLSMRKIARYIGYSATSIYLHFSNKDDLFFTMIDEGMDKLYGLLSEASYAACESGATAVEELESICRAFVDFGLSNREYYEVMFVLHPDTGSRYPPDKYRKARRNIEIIEKALERGLEENVFQVRDTYLKACSVWAMLHGLITLTIARRIDRAIAPEEFVSGTIETILGGLQSVDHSYLVKSGETSA